MAAAVVVILFVKVFAAVLYEYRWYFPPSFESSNFLMDRQDTFTGLYPFAFYIHIIAGPLAIVFGTWLIWSAKRPGLNGWHHRLGRVQVAVIILASLSGLAMARHAFTGLPAALGFALLAMATIGSAIAMVWFAVKRQMRVHQRWATRCYILLVSPLILRIISGVLIVTSLDSVWTYRLNAWLSWIVPMLIYESYSRLPEFYDRLTASPAICFWTQARGNGGHSFGGLLTAGWSSRAQQEVPSFDTVTLED